MPIAAVVSGVTAGVSAISAVGGLFSGSDDDTPALDPTFPLFDSKGNGFDENMKGSQIKAFKAVLRLKFPHLANVDGFSTSGWWNSKCTAAAKQIGIWTNGINNGYGGVTLETFNSIMAGNYDWNGGGSSSVPSSQPPSSGSGSSGGASSTGSTSSTVSIKGISGTAKSLFTKYFSVLMNPKKWLSKDGLPVLFLVGGAIFGLYKYKPSIFKSISNTVKGTDL